ncbi:hypothetical protein [Bordetella ansorpii]|nr:hypothetical protein [Bordetella ansorpii]
MSNAMHPIDAHLVMSALGRGSLDQDLLQRFAQAGLFNWPDPDDDREGAAVEEYWRYGFTLEFADTLAQERLLGVSGLQGPLAVSAILFFSAGVGGHAGWQQALPYDLSFGMSPADLERAFGPPRATRAPYGLPVSQFLVDAYVLDVCYAPEGQGNIDFFSFRLQNIYERGEAPVSDRDWKPLARMIGKPVTDTTLLQLVEASVGAPVTASDLSSHENTQFHRQCGLSFYALPAAELGGAGKQKCVAGFKMSRAGVYGSKGYSGALPFGLVFADGPDAIREKLPETAKQGAFEASGRFTCRTDSLFFHVHYSLIFWQIIAVSVFHLAMDFDSDQVAVGGLR